jgi:hypothetical protein
MMNNQNNTNFKMMNGNQKQRQFRTKIIQVDPMWVGLIIGKAGATIKTLAKESGDSCRIMHDRDQPGTFTISARTSQACMRAEIKVKELIKSKEQQPTRMTNHYVSKTQSGTTARFNGPSHYSTKNAYSILSEEKSETTSAFTAPTTLDGMILAPKKEEDDYFTMTKSKSSRSKSTPKVKKEKQTVQLCFKDDDDIRARKHSKWYNHHASEEEKNKYDASQARYTKQAPPPPQVLNVEPLFPTLGNPKKVEHKWGTAKDLELVKRVETPEPEEENEFGELNVLVKGEKEEKPLLKMQYDRHNREKTSYTKYEFSEEDGLEDEEEYELNKMEDERLATEYEEEEEWSDGEFEYGRFDDEVDHTLLVCA